MTYRQDTRPLGSHRVCVVCNKDIVHDEWMMDLFRDRGGVVDWAHETCVRKAMETWIEKKRQSSREKT